ELEAAVQSVCRHGIRQGWVRSAHDCAEGGVAIALAEACIAGQLGAQISIPTPASALRWDEILFGEGGARILVSVDTMYQGEWEDYLQQFLNHAWQKLGQVTPGSQGFVVKTENNLTLINASMEDISSPWLTAIETALAAD
ncbi:MAG TPA: AIR synthase-related protein, partial [Stenomitos sp.]